MKIIYYVNSPFAIQIQEAIAVQLKCIDRLDATPGSMFDHLCPRVEFSLSQSTVQYLS